VKNILETMTDSDESSVMIGLKCSMQRMRDERNKYREMHDRTVRELKDEKRSRKAVHCRCIITVEAQPHVV